MGVDVAALDLAADAFAEVAFGQGEWSAALDRLTRAAGAAGAIMLPVFDRVPGAFPGTESMGELLAAYVRDGWVQADQRQVGVGTMLRQGIFTDRDCGVTGDIPRSAYYQDFLGRHGLSWFAGLRVDVGGEPWCLAIQRARAADPYSDADLAALAAVGPRISVHASILRQIDGAHRRGVTEAIEAMTTPAFLIDRMGRVVAANSASALVLGQGIDVVDGHFSVEGPDGRSLESFIAGVLHATGREASGAGMPFAIRRAGGRPLVLRVQRLRGAAETDYFSTVWGLVTVSDPDRRPGGHGDELGALLGLTARETRILASLIACDGDTAAVCAECGIGYETLKTHLRNIHGKAGTRTIGGLVALVTRMGPR